MRVAVDEGVGEAFGEGDELDEEEVEGGGVDEVGGGVGAGVGWDGGFEGHCCGG